MDELDLPRRVLERLAVHGGWVQSRIRVDAQQQTSTSSITITAVGQDGNDWFRLRHPDGSWTDWRVSCLVDPNNQICA